MGLCVGYRFLSESGFAGVADGQEKLSEAGFTGNLFDLGRIGEIV